MLGEETIEYLNKYNLWDFVTPDEKDFISDLTDKKKIKKLGNVKVF